MSLISTALAWAASGFDKAARAARWFARKPGKGERAVAGLVSGGGAWTHPATWGADKQEQARHYRLWTYIAVKAITENIARHSIQAAYVKAAGSMPPPGKKFLSAHQRLKIAAKVQPHEELEPVDSDHPFLQLLNNPNGPDTAFTFLYRTVIALELCGEAYWMKVRSGLGSAAPPVELYCLYPQWVTTIPGKDRLIDRFEVRPTAAVGGQPLIIQPEDMVYFHYPSPLSMLAGYSPLQAGAEWVDTAEAIDSARWYLFENGQWPGMSVELDPDVFGKGSVTDTEINRFYAQFDERIKGKERAGKPIIFRPGMKPSQMTRSPVEMDYIASADQMRDWQLALHRVSKFVAGISEDVNFATATAARAAFLHDTVGPKLAFMGQVITEQLAREFDESLIAYWPDLAPEDPEQVNRDLAADFAAGAITPNEWRAKRGREPYQHGGDDPLIPSNLTPMPWATGEPDEFAMAAQGGGAGAGGESGGDESGGAPAAAGMDEYGPLPKNWDESKHPRGQPENAGQFGPGGGGAKPARARKPGAAAPPGGGGAGRRAAAPADVPPRPAGGFATDDAAAAHGKAMAAAYDADPRVASLKQAATAAVLDIASFSAAQAEAREAGDFDKELKAIKDIEAAHKRRDLAMGALADESRRAFTSAFAVPEADRADIKATESGELGTDRRRQKWAEAKAFLGRVAAAGALGRQRVRLAHAGDGRPYYEAGHSAGPTIATDFYSETRHTVHEFGHHLEELPHVRDRVQSFYERRFGGEQETNLAKAFPDRGYEPDEVGRRDDMQKLFGEHETGLARAYYSGKRYDNDRTEVVSMGLEQLYRDPVRFAKADPEYFGLMVGILQRGG